jgi:succinate dehydrogenase assembly factor 1
MKPAETRAKFDLLIRYTFRTQAASVSPRQISAIEHLLRKGNRQLDIYEAPLVKDCYVSREMKEWNTAFRRGSNLPS